MTKEMLSPVKTIAPKISIGLVVYNGVDHIRQVLDSVVQNAGSNAELIVVDGDSTDGTKDVLGEYAEHIAVLVSEPDAGVYDAMNKVCALASGDWLIFLGCDDVLLGTFDEIAGLLTRPDVVYHGDAIFRSNGVVSGGRFSKYKLMNWNICHQAIFYPRSVYKNYSYSLEFKWLSDYAYNIRLMGDRIPFVYLSKRVSIYNDKGRSSVGDAEFEKAKLKLIRDAFGPHYWALKLVRNIVARVVNNARRRWQSRPES